MKRKKVLYLLIVSLFVFLINSNVFAVSEKYEVIKSKGWATVTDVSIKNALNGKKATEYVVQYPNGHGISEAGNTNKFCVFPVKYMENYYIYFPLSNSCKTTITYNGTTNNATSSNFKLNINVESSLPTLRQCSADEKNSLGFEDNEKSACYYCDSHQCLGNIKLNEDVKELGIIYKEAGNPLQIAFAGDERKYSKNNSWAEVNVGIVNSIKSLKDKKAMMIKLSGQVGKTSYLSVYNDNSIAGAGVVEVVGDETQTPSDNTPTTLTKGCPADYLNDIKKISGVGGNLVCYYCKKDNCKGNIQVDKNTNTVAIVYQNASRTLKISLEKSAYFQSKNEWQKVNFHSIQSIYGSKSDKAILLNLTGKDGTLQYDVKYNDNSDAGSGQIIIGNGVNPEGGQLINPDGYNPGDKIPNDCNVIPPEIRKWITNILNFVKYVALVLVIALGALDFVQAAGTGEPDAMKKAGQKFMKRLIAVVVLFLLQVIVDFILNMVNIYGVDLNDPTCTNFNNN